MILYGLLVAAIIAADQLSKAWIRTNLAVGVQIPIIGDWMRITHVQNSGTAFSMFSGNQWVTVVLTTVLIIVCLIFAVHELKKGSRLLGSCMVCILAGGLGNMIDRLRLGYVTDMISCGRFAVFNVADIFVTCGCIIAMFYVLLTYKDEQKAEDGKDE